MSVSTIVFDFGSVLAWPPGHDEFSVLADQAAMDVDRFVDRYYQPRHDYDHGLLTDAAYWAKVLDRTDIPSDMVSSLTQADVGLWRHVNQVAIDWALALMGEGYLVGILSNMPAEFADILAKQAPWFNGFNVRIISGHSRMSKPSEEIYHLLLDQIAVAAGVDAPAAASSVLFLDDLQANVDAARGVGLNAEVYTAFRGGLARIAERYKLPKPPTEPPVSDERMRQEHLAPHRITERIDQTTMESRPEK